MCIRDRAVPENEDVFIAFARVYSGCLRKGQEVYVLGPKHDPAVGLQMVCIINLFVTCGLNDHSEKN